jgi:hypothetical protein
MRKALYDALDAKRKQTREWNRTSRPPKAGG